jgi:hypothetical protein
MRFEIWRIVDEHVQEFGDETSDIFNVGTNVTLKNGHELSVNDYGIRHYRTPRAQFPPENLWSVVVAMKEGKQR